MTLHDTRVRGNDLTLPINDLLYVEAQKNNGAVCYLQGGEVEAEANTEFVEECLRRIRRFDLGVTLSLGEQDEDVYRRWKEAGASRYLLRIETSSSRLYSSLHPPSHSFERRVECLRALRRCG